MWPFGPSCSIRPKCLEKEAAKGYACRFELRVTWCLFNQDTLESERVLERERAELKAYFEKAGSPPQLRLVAKRPLMAFRGNCCRQPTGGHHRRARFACAGLQRSHRERCRGGSGSLAAAGVTHGRHLDAAQLDREEAPQRRMTTQQHRSLSVLLFMARRPDGLDDCEG